MRSTEYFSPTFKPQSGKILTAELWIEDRIKAYKETIELLLMIDYRDRDMRRINDITKAIKWWNKHLMEINCIEGDVE